MAKLPIMPVVSAAFRRVAGSPQQAIKVGLPYFGLLAVLGVIEALVGPSDPTAMGAGGGILTLGLLVLQIVIYTWMAIAWHRVTLVGFSTDQGAFRMQFGTREWRFLGYSLLIYPLVIMVVLTVAVLAFVSGALATLGGIVLALLAVFLILRCCLVLPATAIDHPTSLKTSWQQTDGAFWQILAIDVIVVLAIAIPIAALSAVLGLVLSGGGFIGVLLIYLILVPVQIAATFVLISALSYTYRYLSGHPDPLSVTP